MSWGGGGGGVSAMSCPGGGRVCGPGGRSEKL